MPKRPPLVPLFKATKRPPNPRRQHYQKLHKALREQVLARDPICQVCNNAFATDAHHKVYPAHSADDYLAVCAECHGRYHAKENR